MDGVNEDGSRSSRELQAAKLNEIIHQFRDEHAPRNMEAAVSDFARSPSTRILSQIRLRHADILMNILIYLNKVIGIKHQKLPKDKTPFETFPMP